MAVSPCRVLCSVYAHASASSASHWGLRRATGEQRFSSAGILVRVLEPSVKAGLSQGRSAHRHPPLRCGDAGYISSIGNWGTFRKSAVLRVTTQVPVNRAVAAITLSAILSP